jgi:glycosyltransferase involved in cell wall biosynthesis
LKELNKQKKEANRKQFKSIYYFPVDFNLTPNLAVGLDYFDQLATFTEYGREQVLKLQPNVRSKLNVINHGSNPNDFYVEPFDMMDFRHEFFKGNSNKFIITNVNRNQSRKDIPTTIFGFLEYWQEYNQNSFLYLHMHPEDPMGWNLKTILNQTVLQEGRDYMFLPENYRAEGAPLDVLRSIYNASDVFLTTATGGGWELTVTEAMACGLPVIMPYHTSHLELGGANGERCWFLKTLYPTVAMVDNIIRYQCDMFEIAEKLDEVQKTIENAASGITSRQIEALKYVEKLSWGELADRFSEHIKRLG